MSKVGPTFVNPKDRRGAVSKGLAVESHVNMDASSMAGSSSVDMGIDGEPNDPRGSSHQQHVHIQAPIKVTEAELMQPPYSEHGKVRVGKSAARIRGNSNPGAGA